MSFRSDNTGGLESEETVRSEISADHVRLEWKLLWCNRIEDEIRAEGIADKDYSLLFVERGTVIIATRDYKRLDLREILSLHKIHKSKRAVTPHPSIGGWRKFARSVLNKQKRFRRLKEPDSRRNFVKNLQLKKGGRGWLHRNIKMQSNSNLF